MYTLFFSLCFFVVVLTLFIEVMISKVHQDETPILCSYFLPTSDSDLLEVELQVGRHEG